MAKDILPGVDSRRQPLRVALFVVFVCLIGRIGYEFYCDVQDGGRRMDRWLALTGPITRPILRLSMGASSHAIREFSRQALARQPYPHSLEWLLSELKDNPLRSCELAEEDWVRFGLPSQEVQVRVLAAALQADCSEGTYCRNFLVKFTSRFEADSWVWTEILAAAQREANSDLVSLLPYRVRLGSQPMGSESFRSIVATINRGEETKSEGLDLMEQENLLFWLAEHHPDQLEETYYNGRGRLKAVAGVLLLQRGQVSSRPWLRHISDQDLPVLASYELDRELLSELAGQLPDTRFARGCAEYHQIHGHDGAGKELTEPSNDSRMRRQLLRNASKSELSWRQWLHKYPGHPLADVAAYRLMRSLEWQGKRKQAFQVVLWHLFAPDGPAQKSFRTRFIWMLDVGLSSGELAEFQRQNPDSPVCPLVRYALAVRAARQHRYQRALNLTQGLSLERSYYATLGGPWPAFSEDAALQSLDLCLKEQRSRWQAMLGQDRRTWARRWSDDDGWRLGYLYLHAGQRRVALEAADGYVDSLALEPDGRPDAALLRRHLQQANQRVVALELLARLAQDQEVLNWRIRLLYQQKVEGCVYESRAILPLPGLPKAPRDTWYASQVEYLTRCLEQRYPGSELCDDALMQCYRLTGDQNFLREIRLFYPGSNSARMLPLVGSELESTDFPTY